MVHRLKTRDNGRKMRGVKYIEETDGVTDDDDDTEEQLVQRIDEKGSKSFYMEGMMCDKYFKVNNDTRSPVSNFT